MGAALGIFGFSLAMTTRTIVFEGGTDCCKVGLAGDNSPSIVRSIYGNRANNAVGLGKSSFIGDEALGQKDLVLHTPLHSFTSWIYFDHIFHYSIYNVLQVAPEEHSLVLLVPLHVLRSASQVERLVQNLFETYSFKAVNIDLDLIYSLYKARTKTGIVVNCGAASVSVYAFLNNKQLDDSYISNSSGSTTSIQQLLNSLQRQPGNESRLEDCFVALDYQRECESTCKEKERFQAPELLFHKDSALHSFESPKIHEMIYNSILKCGEEIREELFGNIVLTGGGSKFPGLTVRLRKELCAMAPSMPVFIIESEHAEHLSWNGASSVYSAPDFDPSWFTYEQYEEYGPAMIHTRCLTLPDFANSFQKSARNA